MRRVYDAALVEKIEKAIDKAYMKRYKTLMHSTTVEILAEAVEQVVSKHFAKMKKEKR